MAEKLSADELERLAGAVKRYASAKADAERIGLGCSVKACYDSDRQYLADRELLADQYLANHATDLAAANAAKEQAEKWQWRFSDKLVQDEQCHDWGELFAEVVKLAAAKEQAEAKLAAGYNLVESALMQKLTEIEKVARKAVDAARHYPLWSWSDVEAELAECETELTRIIHPQPEQPK